MNGEENAFVFALLCMGPAGFCSAGAKRSSCVQAIDME